MGVGSRTIVINYALIAMAARRTGRPEAGGGSERIMHIFLKFTTKLKLLRTLLG